MTPSALPSLRRIQAADPLLHGTYTIAGSSVVLRGERKRGWQLRSIHDDAMNWLGRHDLIESRFATRRQALEVFACCHATDPSPPDRYYADDLPLNPVKPGEYRTPDGLHTVRRATVGWQVIFNAHGKEWPKEHVRTLPLARRAVAEQRRVAEQARARARALDDMILAGVSGPS